MDKEEINRKIKEFEKLEPNWDNYGAPPPNNLAVANAFKIADFFIVHSLPGEVVMSIVPDVEGGVCFYFTPKIRTGTTRKYIAIECDNDGDIGINKEGSWKLITENDLRTALDEIGEFLQQ
ncbi:MAG: hypothetical protein V1867_02210 [Candidatus Falkowbacteria bacterium]